MKPRAREVVIFDYIIGQYTPEKFRRRLDEFQPDVWATSVTLNFLAGAEILKTAKAHCSSGDYDNGWTPCIV
ncbi:MAG: hypothetical protein R2860_13575 [Desulfobacterales bacterium]